MKQFAPLTLESYNGTMDTNFEVVGTRMLSRINLINNSFILWNDEKVIQPELVLYPEVHGVIEGALRNELHHFVECVLTNTPSSIASIEDALYSMKIADEIVASATKKEIVNL